MDFFDLSKEFKKIRVDGMQTNALPKPISPEELECMKAPSSFVHKGTGYASEAAEVVKPLQPQNNLESLFCVDDLTSVGSSASALNDLRKENTLNVFKRFEFQRAERLDLPIFDFKEQILSSINGNPVSIITGQTGCGKTTQIPQMILDQCWSSGEHCNIVVTQPRRLAATSIARRVCEERGWPLESVCGYKIGLDRKTSPDTRLCYVTTGVLLHDLVNKKSLEEYTHIFIDEVHERTADMDFLLLIIKQMLTNPINSGVKIILMSATMQTELFEKYFRSGSGAGGLMDVAPAIQIGMINKHRVQIYHLEDLAPDIADSSLLSEISEPTIDDKRYEICIKLIKEIMELEKTPSSRPKGILIFLPGIHEITELHRRLEKVNSRELVLHPLHSSLTLEEQQAVFKRTEPGTRKVVLSTNIAESSLTVPDVGYVIDFCLSKMSLLDTYTNMISLKLVWASKNNCCQRAGRVGRVGPGRVYRLVSEKFYCENIPLSHPPELLTGSLEHLILKSKLLDIGEPKDVLALAPQPPDLVNIERAVLLLKEVGGLLNTVNGVFSATDGDMTYLGRLMSILPVDVRIAKLIALGYAFGILKEAIIIGASLAGKPMFSRPFNKIVESYTTLLAWANNSNSDAMSMLNAYEAFERNLANGSIRNEREWFRRSFIQANVFREIQSLVREITYRLKTFMILDISSDKSSIWGSIDRFAVINLVIAGAFYPNYFLKTWSSNEAEACKVLGMRNPRRCLYFKNFPPKQPALLYAKRFKELFRECKTEMNVYVEGDGSKILVEFKPEHDSNSSGVLNAVKLGLVLGSYKPMSIPLLTNLEANARAARLGLTNRSLNLLTEPADHIRREPSNLPSVATTTIQIHIEQMIAPDHYLATELTMHQMDQRTLLLQTLNQGGRPRPYLTEIPKIGSLVLARMGSTYQRVRVESVKSIDKIPQISVYSIDFGSRSMVNVKQLSPITDDCEDIVYNTPAYIMECRLCGLIPSSTVAGMRVWSPPAMKEVEKLVKNAILYAKIFSVVNGVVRIELLCDKGAGSQPININELLRSEGYAETSLEDADSLANHKWRQTKLQPVWQQYYDAKQREMYWQENECVEPPKLEECGTKKVLLTGPMSPLEATLYSINKSLELDRVRVGPTSVNHVLLEEFPEDPRDVLLVATHFIANQNRVNLHSSTLMPAIPGMPSLVPLIFAPRAQLNLNQLGSRYTSAFCGLGLDDSQKEIYREHDFEVVFNVIFTHDDLVEVNNLRLLISEVLDGEEVFGERDLTSVRDKVKISIQRLILRTRPKAYPQPAKSLHRWGTFRKTSEEHSAKIYPPHFLPDLIDEKPLLKNLSDIADMYDQPSSFKPCHCNVCDVQLSTCEELKRHVAGRRHKDIENQLMLRL